MKYFFFVYVCVVLIAMLIGSTIRWFINRRNYKRDVAAMKARLNNQ